MRKNIVYLLISALIAMAVIVAGAIEAGTITVKAGAACAAAIIILANYYVRAAEHV